MKRIIKYTNSKALNCVLIVLTGFFISGCVRNIYLEPSSSPTAKLQLDLQAFASDRPSSYPGVFYYDDEQCNNRKSMIADIDNFYREGNPPQDLKNNIWRDYVGYKLAANKQAVISVVSGRMETESTNRLTVFKYTTYRCALTYVFQPEENETYRVFYREADNGCEGALFKVSGGQGKESLLPEPTAKQLTPSCEDQPDKGK